MLYRLPLHGYPFMHLTYSLLHYSPCISFISILCFSRHTLWLTCPLVNTYSQRSRPIRLPPVSIFLVATKTLYLLFNTHTSCQKTSFPWRWLLSISVIPWLLLECWLLGIPAIPFQQLDYFGESIHLALDFLLSTKRSQLFTSLSLTSLGYFHTSRWIILFLHAKA